MKMKLFFAVCAVLFCLAAAGFGLPYGTASAQGITVADDDICTIVCYEKEMVEVAGFHRERPMYPFSVTNKTETGIELNLGRFDEETWAFSYGSVNGADSTIVFVDSSGKEQLVMPAIGPGQTMDFYLEPVGGGTGFTSPEELVNVVIYLELRNTRSGSWSRLYTLRMDEGESRTYHMPSDTVRYENAYFSYEIPSDWERSVVFEGTEYEYERIAPPPDLCDLLSGMTVSTNTAFFYTRQELLDMYKEEHQAYYADPMDYILTYDATAGGRAAQVVEEYNHIADAVTYYYYLQADDGREILIEYTCETEFEPALSNIRDQVLNNIRFHSDGSVPDSGTVDDIEQYDSEYDEIMDWFYLGDWILLSEEEKAQLFSDLSSVRFLASSGAGAWEGELLIDTSGCFTGYYYDADLDEITEVSFSGRFGDIWQTGWKEYCLRVDEADTLQAPGTEARTDYGGHITYTESLMPAGSDWRLTLPGLWEENIPETVKDEIGGTYWEWDDYSDFYTLTRYDDGWGFFSDRFEWDDNPVD